MTADSWQSLGATDPTDLVEARLQSHYAAQVVSGVGRTLLPKQDDDSHTSLEWVPALGALASQPSAGDKSFRAALRFDGLRLLLIDRDNSILFDAGLDGRTVAAAYAWLAQAIGDRLGQAFEQEFTPLHYGMPPHGLGEGARFAVENRGAFAELGRWYADAHLALSAIVAAQPNASPLRCWPHHFDLATLIELDKGRQIDNPRSIGVGLSPGDDSYAEPYWYVGPWPYPNNVEAAPLDSGGHWHTEGFSAAVLPGSRLVGEADQQGATRTFLVTAVEACLRLLPAEDPQT
jgi:hypothetical protein